jgi:LacI family transcriptional regulator
MGQPRSHRPARLEDVAEAAGVHLSTVSRVLNRRGTEAISPQTQLRIEDAARRLRYRPNAMARGLKLASAGALGLLVPSLRNPVYSAIIRGAFDRAWERSFVVLLAEDIGASRAQEAYERLVEQGRIDGLLIASARPGSPLFDHLAENPIPCVFVNRRHLGSGRNAVMREEDAGRLAAEHLLELGHTRLAHIAGPLDVDTARRRAGGFTETVRAAGRRPSLVSVPFDERGGMAAMKQLLDRRTPPTGVFASNINQSVGAIAGARMMGRSIPADLSLVGYDEDPLCECLEVPLTAIRMPLSELGQVAVDALIDQVKGEPPRDITVETAPELIVRGSTAPPGGR